jgi:hypothetical protein
MDQNRLIRAVACADVGGRQARIRLLGEFGAVYVMAPAGEVARLEPAQVEDFKVALTACLVHAVRSRS